MVTRLRCQTRPAWPQPQFCCQGSLYKQLEVAFTRFISTIHSSSTFQRTFYPRHIVNKSFSKFHIHS